MILSKKQNLIIRKLSEMFVPKSRSTTKPEDSTASPRGPLDLNLSSPVSSKRYGSGCVGLGIVTELEESNIVINRYDSARYSGRFRCPEIDILSEEDEEYTYVTSRDGSTKVYYNDNGFELCGDDRSREKKPVVMAADERPVIKKHNSVSSIGFLSLCCLCKKKLQGIDIYMYKGEMGFCSEECRSMQIMSEERITEKCKQQVSRNVDVSSSSHTGDQHFSAGIFVF